MRTAPWRGRVPWRMRKPRPRQHPSGASAPIVSLCSAIRSKRLAIPEKGHPAHQTLWPCDNVSMKTLSVCFTYQYFREYARKKFPHFRDMQNLSPSCGSVGRAFQVGPGVLGYSQEGIAQPASQVPVAGSLPLALRASGFGAHARRGWRCAPWAERRRVLERLGGYRPRPNWAGKGLSQPV